MQVLRDLPLPIRKEAWRMEEALVKFQKKKIVRKYSLPPFKRIVFCQLKDLNPSLMV